MPEIPVSLSERLENYLADHCSYFESNAALRVIFDASPIREWKNELKEADSIASRVDRNIGMLENRHNRSGEWALLLFLQVLQAKYSDSRHVEIGELIEELRKVEASSKAEVSSDEENKSDAEEPTSTITFSSGKSQVKITIKGDLSDFSETLLKWDQLTNLS